MSQRTRILLVVGALILVVAVLTVVGYVSQNQAPPSVPASAQFQAQASTPQPGMIQLYADGKFVANVSPADLKNLPAASFVDKEQGKTQSGWWLRDVIRVYVQENRLTPNAQVTVTGVRKGTENKSATLTWAETLDPANNVLFSPSNDGQSVKVASTLDRLSTRDSWIQGLTQIDIQTKP